MLKHQAISIHSADCLVSFGATASPVIVMTTFACMGLTHGDCLNIKMSSYQYRDPHLIFNMVIPIPGKDALKSSQLWQQFILHSVLLCFGGGPFCPYPSGSFHSMEQSNPVTHDDVIKRKHFPHYWPFLWEIQWSPANSSDTRLWCFLLSAPE